MMRSIVLSCLLPLASVACAEPAFQRLVYSDKQWYGSTFWTGPNWTRVGKDWHHPGEETPSVRTFCAPHDGRATVTGRVFKLHLNGDGIRASICLGERELWAREIEGRDETGVEHKLSVDLHRGDWLRFIVDKRGSIACDTTGWDPAVRYDDGETFQASKSFGPQQGAGGWYYEMLGGQPPPESLADEIVRHMESELMAAQDRLAPDPTHAAEPELLRLVLAQWLREDQLDERPKTVAAAIADHLQRARDLLADLEPALGAGRLKAERDRLEDLAVRPAKLSPSPPAPLPEGEGSQCWQKLYLEVRLLKRQIALANPLLGGRELLFCKRVPPTWSHLVAQYFGWRQRPGGGLFVLARPGYSLACRDVLAGGLPAGSVLEPRLSYDARRIVFSFVALPHAPYEPQDLPVNEQGPDEAYFHIYEVGADGGHLRQLTSGTYDDLMPTYLPNGEIVFCSTRRQGYSRCFGPEYSQRWHSYTLHRMDADGRHLRRLSANDVSEWFPAVAHTGHMLFARWDYIDRDAVTHQNLWAARPDGTNPVAVWGNAAPKPHCTFQVQPIPGSQKLAFIASAHHAITAGPVCVLDPAVDTNDLSAVTRITPGPFPEAESGKIPEYYQSPWPLSERYFLVAYSPQRLRFQGEHRTDPNPDNALGLYLLDAAGNRELLYRDPQISSTTPIPLAPRPCPPVLPDVVDPDDAPTGEMLVSDVYQGLPGVPRGTIRQLRVVQIFPKTTYVSNQPRIGLAGEENARAILGTVPVEADGSARLALPAGKPVLFQLLDEQGFAWQTMRSTTYVQPGERTACIGCHEPRQAAPPSGPPLAMRRAPSRLEPGELGGRPFAFVEMVQPVLDRHCVRCHSLSQAVGQAVGQAFQPDKNLPRSTLDLTSTPDRGFTRSYWSLCRAPDDTRNLARREDWLTEVLVPRFVQRNQIQTTPVGGLYGARGSRLMKLLGEGPGHYDVKLADGERRRLAAWIDLNAVFYGVYDADGQARQLTGQPAPMPEIQ